MKSYKTTMVTFSTWYYKKKIDALQLNCLAKQDKEMNEQE